MTKQKRRLNQRIKAASAAAARQGLNAQAQPDAAGIDIGAQELVAAVPPGRGEGDSVRTFSSFTSGVEALRDWLVACGIKTVALESTGNYWITTYGLLEDAGIEVCLVNARHVKGVPGKSRGDWRGAETDSRRLPRRGEGAVRRRTRQHRCL